MTFGLGFPEFDDEARFIAARFGNLVCAGAYFPNSQTLGARLGYKLAFCEQVSKKVLEWQSSGYQVILGGDFNIAPKEIDLANPKANLKNPGFLPEERAWMSSFLELGYSDSFRVFCKEGGKYSWWSQRPGVREKNIGWRIDLICISSGLASFLKKAEIHQEIFGSDHCPVSITLG